jgi:hypothetical protein
MVLDPIPKWFMMVALRDGVVLNRLLLVMTTPICLGLTLTLLSRSLTAPNATDSNSKRQDAIVRSMGTLVSDGGA